MDSNVELTGIKQTQQVTPCKATSVPVDFKTPGSCMANRSILRPSNNAFRTPGGEIATPSSCLKPTPGNVSAYKVRMIPTNSAMVTDV